MDLRRRPRQAHLVGPLLALVSLAIGSTACGGAERTYLIPPQPPESVMERPAPQVQEVDEPVEESEKESEEEAADDTGGWGGAMEGEPVDAPEDDGDEVEEQGAESEEGEEGEENEATDGDAAAAPRPLVVAVLSDLNGSYGSENYGDDVHGGVRWIVDELSPDLVLSTGDMVAGQRRQLTNHAAMWRAFHRVVSEPLAAAAIPFAVTPGNHDASASRRFASERQLFVEQWAGRRPDVDFVDDAHYPLRYAFKVGEALFISLDATTVGPLDAEQKAWLAGVLADHRDAETTIVYGHVPLYPVAHNREEEILADPELEAILREGGVDAMVAGHHHAYFAARKQGMLLVTAPCLGSGSRRLLGQSEASPRGVVYLTLFGDGGVDVAMRVAPEFVDNLPVESLPERIAHGGWELERIQPVVVRAE